MKKPENETIYRYIASQYEEELGKQLQAERDLLEQSPRTDTARLDALVRRGTRRRKNMKIVRWTAAVAACVLFAVLIPLWYPLLNGTQPADTAGEEQSAAEAIPPVTGGTQGLIPLSFTMPENFTLEKTDLDNGLSVYYLSDSRQDPVVLQLRNAGEDHLRTDGLTEIEIAGQPVYGRSDAAYHLLTFESEELVYTLTCAYDINTLLPLCESIMSAA